MRDECLKEEHSISGRIDKLKYYVHWLLRIGADTIANICKKTSPQISVKEAQE